MEDFIGIFLIGVPVLAVWLQIRLLRRWDGAFRLGAALPLLIGLLWVGLVAFDLSNDPTAHNLLPFELLIGVLGALLWFAILAVVRWLAGRSRG